MKSVFLGSAVVAALAGSAMAGTVTLGGYTFDDQAFADSLTGSGGNWTTAGGSLESNLVGSNAADYAFSFDAGSFVDLAFTDNVCLDGAGYDLVVYELGVADAISVTINGITNSYASSFTGEMAGIYNLNAAAIDLADFGVGSTAAVRLNGGIDAGGGTVASYTVVGARYSIPAPGSLALLGLGGLMARRRR